ncbi:hypothetical protein STCU_10703 [Strigomonas culicis]|uniref:Uncharacterized protein n=1 Tax=Strigomonas culicis TaxID=28005 RepID=S9TGU2_9TRYP|nr:hypothetical protein STCU_10703 [Strigomonas culicis]|eukprot:EPY17282.1 hypothetical protein STCU_10703 [Strigomonas culicis]
MEPCRRRLQLAMEASVSCATSQTLDEGDKFESVTKPPLFQYASFLLHIKTEPAIVELLDCLSHYPCDDLFVRFFFLSLWSVGYEDSIGLDTRTRALYLALQFRSGVSHEEVEGLLTSLTSLALKQFATHHDVQTLQNCLEPFRVMATDELGSYAMASRCQLSLLVEPEEEALGVVRLWCDRFGTSEAMPSTCGQLLHTLLEQGRNDLAGAVAQLFVERKVPFDDAATLDVLHVCALTALAHRSQQQNLALYVCAQAGPLLEAHAADSAVDFEWWCRFLWQIGDHLSESDAPSSVRITMQGIHIFKNVVQTADHRELLLNRILYVMRSEFDSFLNQEPLLSVETVSQLLLLAPEVGAASSASDPSALVLAATEESLRKNGADGHCPYAVEELDRLKVDACDLERMAAVCLRVGLETGSVGVARLRS